MSIKGLKQDERVVPRAGIIRLGYKTRYCLNQQCKYRLAYNEPDTTTCPRCGQDMGKQTTTEAGHFILKDAPGVAEALGTEAPTELEIYFPFDDIERNFPTYRTLFSASSMVCQGDGQHILHAINPTTGQTVVKDGRCILPFAEKMADNKQAEHKPGDMMPCPALGEPGIYSKCAHCTNRGILLVMLKAAPRMAYFQISTGSIVNLRDLPGQMLNVQEIIYELTGKRKLAGVPFILRRVLRSMSPVKRDRQGNPTGRVRVDKYVLQLEVEPGYMLDLVRAQRRLVDPMARFALTAGPQEYQDGGIVDSPHIINEPPEWEPVQADDGDFEVMAGQDEQPAQPEAPTETEPANSNGHTEKLTRPMTAEQTREAIQKRAEKLTGNASPEQMDYLTSSLSKACKGDVKTRHSVTSYLTGHSSLRDEEWTKGQAKALIDWIGSKEINGYEPVEEVYQEIAAIVRAFQAEQGQLDMFE